MLSETQEKWQASEDACQNAYLGSIWGSSEGTTEPSPCHRWWGLCCALGNIRKMAGIEITMPAKVLI